MVTGSSREGGKIRKSDGCGAQNHGAADRGDLARQFASPGIDQAIVGVKPDSQDRTTDRKRSQQLGPAEDMDCGTARHIRQPGIGVDLRTSSIRAKAPGVYYCTSLDDGQFVSGGISGPRGDRIEQSVFRVVSGRHHRVGKGHSQHHLLSAEDCYPCARDGEPPSGLRIHVHHTVIRDHRSHFCAGDHRGAAPSADQDLAGPRIYHRTSRRGPDAGSDPPRRHREHGSGH